MYPQIGKGAETSIKNKSTINIRSGFFITA